MAAGCSSSSSLVRSGVLGVLVGLGIGGSVARPRFHRLSISSFTVDIAPTMSKFKALAAAATKGASSLQVGVILPDTTSSTR